MKDFFRCFLEDFLSKKFLEYLKFIFHYNNINQHLFHYSNCYLHWTLWNFFPSGPSSFLKIYNEVLSLFVFLLYLIHGLHSFYFPWTHELASPGAKDSSGWGDLWIVSDHKLWQTLKSKEPTQLTFESEISLQGPSTELEKRNRASKLQNSRTIWKTCLVKHLDRHGWKHLLLHVQQGKVSRIRIGFCWTSSANTMWLHSRPLSPETVETHQTA